MVMFLKRPVVYQSGPFQHAFLRCSKNKKEMSLTISINFRWTAIGWPHKIERQMEATYEQLDADEERFRKLQTSDQANFNDRLDTLQVSTAYCPPPFAKAGKINTHSSVYLSVRLSACPSVTKTLTCLISSEVLMIEHWYLACMILVTSPFNWHYAVNLTLTYFKVKVVAGRGPQFSEFACFKCMCETLISCKHLSFKHVTLLYFEVKSKNLMR